MNHSSIYPILVKTMPAMLAYIRLCLFFLFTIGVAAPPPAGAQDDVQRLINNGGYSVEDGSGRHAYRENDLFVPASTMKVLTSLIALELLGPDYRFETHIFLDSRGNLYIKGYGDPLLTSEILLELGKKLAEMGVRQLQSISLDDSTFDLRGETASEENSAKSYDAPNGALAVNFNTVSLVVSAKGRISSGESQTPLLPLMREIAVGLAPGSHRLNVNMLPPQPGKSPTLRYAGELFTAQLKQAGITIRYPCKIQATPRILKPILIYKGRSSLEEIIRECLKYSNNFIANQLFLACGIRAYGLPATWAKSRQTFTDYTATTLGIPKGLAVVMEGAGLSRQNRISPAAFIQVLNRFKPFAALLSQRDSIPVKSGTLTGVYCFAGYFPKGETLIPFAIFLNQAENNRKQLLKELQLLTLGSAAAL